MRYYTSILHTTSVDVVWRLNICENTKAGCRFSTIKIYREPGEMIFRKFRFVILSLLLTEIIIIAIYALKGNSSITSSREDNETINVFLGRVSKKISSYFWPSFKRK